MSVGANLKDLRRLLDENKVPTYWNNVGSRDLPVLVVIRKNGQKLYIVVGKESYSIGEETFSLDTTSEHKTVRATVDEIMRLFEG